MAKRKKLRSSQGNLVESQASWPQPEVPDVPGDLSAQVDAAHDELLGEICAAIEAMRADMRLLAAQREQTELVNVGLMKLILVQEFRDQQHIGQCYQRQQQQLHEAGQPAQLLTDEQRDNASARAAFDRLIG